ncbi:MAG: omega-6 fatty acid desaturase (delta-12 desaturase) [Bradymonadia bacterium]|jgi:omega-6 fatty acid desaturase (delta-12 desaturase)
MQATKPFAKEDRAKTWKLLLVTILVLTMFSAGSLFLPWWPAKLVSGFFAGLTSIRLFIFYHDYLHGAILRKSKAGGWVMSAVGFYMLAVRSVWRETHNYHHKNNAKMLGSAIGSFPVVTVGMWRGLDPARRRIYRVIRHPLSIFGGYLTVFLIGMTISPFKRDAKKHWGGPLAVVLHVGAIVAVGLLLNWTTAFTAVVFPAAVAFGSGSYLFYAQHNFPGMQLKGRREWDYTFAAVNSSSMFDMGPVMHWFTGNIGYHHVHHLNHTIPFYNLPACMDAIPELQSPGRTSWKPKDVLAALRLSVWDPDIDRMMTWAELRDQTSKKEPAVAGANAQAA